MSTVALSALPKLLRDKIHFIPDPPCKRELTLALTKLIEDFFSSHTLTLTEDKVAFSYLDIPVWRIDTVLAKLRSLLEQEAKKQIRIFCAELNPEKKRELKQLLKKAGIYSFRNDIDLDLYVGVHTAISAYFKMIGLALYATSVSQTSLELSNATRELFKTLKFIATLPLKHLMAVDGLFWDSKQYTIPSIFSWEIRNQDIFYFLPLDEILSRIQFVMADEAQSGCPALRARTPLGESVFELVEKYCLEAVQKFYLNVEFTANFRK